MTCAGTDGKVTTRRRSTSSQPCNRAGLRGLVIAVALAATLGFAGCVGLTGNPSGKGGGGTPAGGSAVITVTPSPASFGNVSIGSSGSQTMNVSNPGTAALTITNIVTSGSGFSVSGLSVPLTLAVGQSKAFTASFQPASAGSASGSITITNSATSSALVISLNGTGVASTTTHSVALSWQASSSPVVGYLVYRGTVSSGPYSKLTSSLDSSVSYTDSSVASGQTYFYVVTSVDSTDTESTYSNPVSAAIP